MRGLTAAEHEALQATGDAANLFAALPVVHPEDLSEYVRACHIIQNIILARPATEVMNRLKKEAGYTK